MAVTINKITLQQRIDVTGDPTTANALPCTVNAGDTVYRADTGTEYLMTSSGLVAGSSLDESPVFTTVSATTSVTVTSASAVALAVGLTGATNPAFSVDSSTGSQAAGLKVTGAATGGAVAIAATDSGADASISLDAKGAGSLSFQGTATGPISLGRATTAQVTLGVAGKLTVTGTVTAAGAVADGTALTVTPTAAANSDVLTGLKVSVAAGTPGSFTGLVRQGISVPAFTVVGDTSPGNPVGISVGIITGTGASVASALSLAPPTGATTNYLIRHTTAATFNVTDAGLLTTASNAVLKAATAAPATAGAVAAGAPLTLYSGAITIEVTSDAPTHTRAKGSICINTGGGSTSTRMYVNTDSGTTWANFTTSA